ncbi:hypothetical protein [Rosenbergiella epipactidis]|uniref:hypothetical protein n=1 Tax=Rosenbergiella epipactidis TaxID=1544694 RepID=UPI001F4F7DD0|nr:hypothetical protein [Rosenbergiella epipactidis]
MNFQNFSTNNNMLLSLCSEATLEYWSFERQELNVKIKTYDDDELVIVINTDVVHSSPLFTNGNLNIFRIVVQDMHEVLQCQNGYYIPPEKFSDLMKLSAKNYSSYYGRKNTWRYNLAFVGSENFINCPILSLDDSIKWKFCD